MSNKLTLSLLVWSCSLLVQNCTGQEEECQCNLGHGRCDENGVCRCDPGWEGPQCDECARMPGCVHGSCHQPWQCTCEDGWAGRFCDKDVFVCINEQPCKNGATCFTNDSGDYSCFCPEGFHGKNCEMKTGPCSKTRNPCKNGGLCEDSNGFAFELSCRCLAGYVGPRCEVDVDDCLMRPCANGATCEDGVNRFSCLCPAGFSGRFCTINDDDCASQPCQNGGRCLDRVDAFQCLCPPGFSGKTCLIPETRPPTWVSPGWTGGGGGGGASRGNSSSRRVTAGGGERLLKISVKEVVTQREPGLSEAQLITLLVLGGMTLAVVGLTAALVLRGHWHERCCSCCRPSRRPRPIPAPSPARQECKISFLHEPSPRLQKKRLNTAVI